MEIETLEIIKRLLQQGKTVSETAKQTNLTYDKVRHYFRNYKQLWNLPNRNPPLPYTLPNTTEETSKNEQEKAISLSRERAYRQAEIAQLKQLTERKAVIDEWRDALRNAALTLEAPKLVSPLSEKKKFDNEVAILIISDVHVGQYTPGRISGGWTQTIEVTRQQFKKLSTKLLQAYNIQSKSVLWRELIIFDLGDDVENSNMRASQHRMADPLVAQQTAAYGKMLAELVLSALRVFPKITIERVPGNHGRTTQKPGNGGLSELDPIDSFDWLAGEFAREILRDAIDKKRVTLINHDGFWGVSHIFDSKIVFEHGSSLRYSQSFGGIPYYAIDRAAAAFRDLEGEFSLLLFAHYHRPYVLPSGYGSVVIGNGCLPPTSPFVASNKHAAIKPSQTLLSYHRDSKLTMIKHLYLDFPKDA